MAARRRRQQETTRQASEKTVEDVREAIEGKWISYADEARAIKARAGYYGKVAMRAAWSEAWGSDEVAYDQLPEPLTEPGRMSVLLYGELELLLRKPIPVAYVEFTPKKQSREADGLPYDVTGLVSMQPQVDRLNEVIGKPHWRKLLWFSGGGSVCKAIIIIGNDLQYASLDHEKGDLVPWRMVGGEPREAEIIADSEGFGGHTSKKIGDQFKGAESNAIKRTIAHIGTGSEIYRVEYDPDSLAVLRGEIEPAADAPPPPQRPQARPMQSGGGDQPPAQAGADGGTQPSGEQELTNEDAEKALKGMLANERHPNHAKIREAYDTIMALPEDMRPNPNGIYAMIDKRRDDANQLDGLITRAKNSAATSG